MREGGWPKSPVGPGRAGPGRAGPGRAGPGRFHFSHTLSTTRRFAPITCRHESKCNAPSGEHLSACEAAAGRASAETTCRYKLPDTRREHMRPRLKRNTSSLCRQNQDFNRLFRVCLQRLSLMSVLVRSFHVGSCPPDHVPTSVPDPVVQCVACNVLPSTCACEGGPWAPAELRYVCRPGPSRPCSAYLVIPSIGCSTHMRIEV